MKPTLMTASNAHIVFAGGGTWGHLFPGLAVARRLAEWLPDARITFAGTGKSRERRQAIAAGFPYIALPASPVPSRASETWRFLSHNVAGYFAAKKFLRDEPASLVVGLGGFASAAVVQAAIARQVPTVLLEQNALPGRATRWYASSASLLCAAFDDVRQHLGPRTPVLVTGNPVRPEFDAIYRRGGETETERDPQAPRRLVILGGSNGASTLNEVVPRTLHMLRLRLRNWTIVHQTGRHGRNKTAERYEKLQLPAEVVSFVDDMAGLLGEADLVIGRAGGTTLAELAMAGVPAVLVPYPHATGDHQLRNARAMARHRACRIVDQRNPGSHLDQRLAVALDDLLSNDALRGRMAGQIRSLAKPHAAEDVARAVCSLVGIDPRRAAA
ncbi:MAG: UDP-N-acetylglucosamine--N-acetylmuramyl-(pentapeptide) pyrophosphoryl-undecaprenol N-acetylglucosamine transferase [Pirellulales bacterium]